MGVLEGKACDAPQPSLRGKSAYRRRLWEDRCLLMQNQTELSPGRDFLPALHKTCRIKEDPCHRRLHRWGRASDTGCLSRLAGGLLSRRQKDSFPCSQGGRKIHSLVPITRKTRNFLKQVGRLCGGGSSFAEVRALSHWHPGVNGTSLVPTDWADISVFKESCILSIVTILQAEECKAQRD